MARTSYMKKLPKYLRCLPLVQCHVLASMYLQPHRVYPMIILLEKIMLWFTDVAVHYSGTTQKWTAAVSKPLSETTLKSTSNEKSSQQAKLWAVHMVMSFVQKEKWADMWSSTASWAVANGMDGCSITRKEEDWKIGEKDICGRSMQTDLSQWTKDVKILMSQVNAHQKVTSASEKFNNQVDRMTHSVTVCLFSQESILLPNEHT